MRRTKVTLEEHILPLTRRRGLIPQEICTKLGSTGWARPDTVRTIVQLAQDGKLSRAWDVYGDCYSMAVPQAHEGETVP